MNRRAFLRNASAAAAVSSVSPQILFSEDSAQPISATLAADFTRRPEYFGMKLAKFFVGGTLLKSTLACESDRVRVYAGRNHGRLLVVAINKSGRAANIKLPFTHSDEQWLLSGPAVDAKQDVTIAKTPAKSFHKGVLRVEPYSAVLVSRT